MAQERNLAKDQDQERWDSSGKAHLIFVTFVADCVKILDLHYHVKAILQSWTCLQLRCPLALGSLIPGQRKDTQGSLDIRCRCGIVARRISTISTKIYPCHDSSIYSTFKML